MTAVDDVTGVAGADGGVALTQRFAVDGVELAWDRWGPDEGTPLVLGHGFSGSVHDFALQIPVLAESRPVIAVDKRGHGFSTKTADAGSYTVERLVADEIAFLEANADGPVDLLGHSMGGRVALRTTIERPDLVRSLVLMDTSAWSFQTSDPDLAALLAGFFETYDPAQGLPDTSVLDGPEAALIAAQTPDAWRRRKDAIFAGFDPVALQALGFALFSDALESMRPRLGEVTCVATVIAGSNDHPFADQAPDLAAELGDGSLVLVDGAYHSPQLTHPTEWRAAVEAHLDRAAGSAKPTAG